MEFKDTISATKSYAIRLGDDALVLGHRLSEWSSNGPFLEEDLALSNTALDFIGRARMFYSYAADLSGDGLTEDDLAYTRDERDFQNLLILELPRGDFAFTMVRQYFVDVYNILLLEQLCNSTDNVLASIAAKSIKESRYHLRRSHDWILRLGDGTAESHERTQRAIDSLWGYTQEFFEQDALELKLIELGIAVNNQELSAGWSQQISHALSTATLSPSEETWAVRGGRDGYHTENLGHLLTELQFLSRSMPGLQW